MDQFDLDDAHNTEVKLKKIYDDASPIIASLSDRMQIA